MPIGKKMVRRTFILLTVFAVCGFLAVIFRIAKLQLIDGEYYRSKAERQQLSDTVISALRGTIYDSDMNVLAQSASVWLVYVNPSKIKKDETRQKIASELSVILETDAQGLLEDLMKTDSGYEKVKGRIEKDKMLEVQTYITENGYESIVCIDPDTKRYYPNATLASALLGFTGTEDVGRSGLEYMYNDELTGTAGRIVTAKDGLLKELPDSYESTYDAQQGESLVLTIDEVVQYNLENALKQTMIDTSAKYAYGIIMDVDTGAVLASVSLPEYDLNNPTKIDDALLAEIMAIPDETQRSEALTQARNSQWRNRSVSDSYEPGSVSKIVTVAAALEEGTVDTSTSYYCTGEISVADRVYNCWNTGGHGSETLVDLLKNSCNPFAITVAKTIGTELYYKYFKAFGFTEQTDIDLPGEFSPVAGVTYHTVDSFGIAQLASYSFGQTFQVSPIQMITAVSAVANGGKLMRPYVVAKSIDENGNTVSETKPFVRRTVVSEATASLLSEMLENVVSSGTGKNAYVAGYSVAGKTGTSEKLLVEDQYVASFVGFAPSYDPKVAMLIAIDEPQGAHGGGAVAAPVAGEVFEQILPYLNIEAKYSESELSQLVDNTPDCVGKTVEDAKNLLATYEYTVTVIGDGASVVAQSPEADRLIPKNGVIILYTQADYSAKPVTMPDFTGYTVSQANQRAVELGLNVKISGSSLNSSTDVVAYKQSIAAGEATPIGSVVTVYFKTTVGVED